MRLYAMRPQCVYCRQGYSTWYFGPRGGYRGCEPCVNCGRKPGKPAGGYIPLKSRKRAKYEPQNAQALS